MPLAEVTLTVKGSIAKLSLKADDKVLVTLDETKIDQKQFTAIREQVQLIFPEHEIVMCANGVTIQAIGAEDGDE